MFVREALDDVVFLEGSFLFVTAPLNIGTILGENTSLVGSSSSLWIFWTPFETNNPSSIPINVFPILTPSFVLCSIMGITILFYSSSEGFTIRSSSIVEVPVNIPFTIPTHKPP